MLIDSLQHSLYFVNEILKKRNIEMMIDFWNVYLACKKAKEKNANAYRIAIENHREICKMSLIGSGKRKGSERETDHSKCKGVHLNS